MKGLSAILLALALAGCAVGKEKKVDVPAASTPTPEDAKVREEARRNSKLAEREAARGNQPVSPLTCDVQKLYEVWKVATDAQKDAAGTIYMDCYRQHGGKEEPACTKTQRPTGEQSWTFMSGGCGNVTPHANHASKGGTVIASGHPYALCPADTPKEFLELYSGPARCRPKVSMDEYGRQLELMGFPVAPNADGFRKFMLSGDVVAVGCTLELLAKVNMARTNASGNAFDWTHVRRTCYEYGVNKKVESLFVYKRVTTVDVTKCEMPTPPPKPPAKSAPPPASAVSKTPAACPSETRKFRLHVWDERVPQVSSCLQSSHSGFSSPDAFSRNRCIVGLVKGEKAVGSNRPWHVHGEIRGYVATITPDGKETARLRDITMNEGYLEFTQTYAEIAGKNLEVVFTNSAAGAIVSPKEFASLWQIRIDPKEFERPQCAYDISGATRK